VLWTEELLGNLTPDNPLVTTGPFAYWTLIGFCQLIGGGEYLVRRNFELPANQTQELLYNDDRIEAFINKTEFKEVVCFIDCEVEDLHGGPHSYVGGLMSDVFCSPSDPIFYMHHAFVDFQWEEFRQKSQVTDPEMDYPTSEVGNIGGSQHEPFAPMDPFGVPNIHGLSNHYTNYYYTYEPRPLVCTLSDDCGTRFLWCDTIHARCMSKIFLGGICDSLPDEACYGENAKCEAGICTGPDSTL